MPMTQKEMVKLLTAHGWIKTRGGKGSHIKMKSKGKDLSQSFMVS